MFLNENVQTTSTTVSADPMYGAQLIQEASDEWNELCMKMIKLEHTAIVSEDAQLLQEGVKEFAQKAIAHLQLAGKKFLEYLERVRVEWTKIQAAVMTKFVNTDAINALYSKVKEGKFKLDIDKTKWEVAQAVVAIASNPVAAVGAVIAAQYVNKDIAKVLGEIGKDFKANADVVKTLSKLNLPDNVSPLEIGQQDIKNAVDFLKKRAVAVKNIQVLKNYYSKKLNAAISELKKDNAKVAAKSVVVALQSAINKLIIAVNKETSTAIKICNAVKAKGSGVSEKQYKKTVKEVKKNKGLYTESVLDQF